MNDILIKQASIPHSLGGCSGHSTISCLQHNQLNYWDTYASLTVLRSFCVPAVLERQTSIPCALTSCFEHSDVSCLQYNIHAKEHNNTHLYQQFEH